MFWLHKLEDTVLALFLGGMVVLACGQIFLRNVSDVPLFWVEPLLRAMVLWIALLGALAAGRDNKHINIDALSRLLPEAIQCYVQALSQAFAACVCVILAYSALALVKIEYQGGTDDISGIPIWLVQTILPIGFLLLGLRFTGQAILLITKAIEKKP